MIQTIPIASITVPPDRQRQSFDDQAHGDLIASIERNGLLSPIILRREGESFVLVAGERRLRAMTMLNLLGTQITHAGHAVEPGHIPYINFGELSPLAQMEIEYAENADRDDLTWQEKALATEKLHALRKAQADAAGRTHSILATAQEIFGDTLNSEQTYAATTKVTESLVTAKHLDNPTVAKAKTLKEAVKIIKRQDETKRREYLAQVAGTQTGAGRFTCHNVEALGWLRECSSSTFDIILTDPPYGMGADTFGDAAGRMSGIEHEYTDGAEPTLELLQSCIPEWYRVAKPEAHLYLWCDIDMFTTLREICRLAGWWTFRTPLINLKPSGGRVPWPSNGPRRSYEICLYAVKGKKPVTSIQPDYFESRLVEGNLGHGAQKPVEAYVNLLKRSAVPGDIILDSFAGTGTIFAAAAELGLTAVGTELNPAAYGICVERIGGLS